jgi:hypothetical protein
MRKWVFFLASDKSLTRMSGRSDGMKPEIDQNFVLKAKERGRERANDIRDTPLSKKVLARGRALMESYVRAGSKKAHA